MYENLIIGVDGRQGGRDAASRHQGIARHIGHDDVVALLRCAGETIAVAPHGYSNRPRRLERLGIAFDGSPESAVALAHAGLLAENRGCEVVVSRLPEAAHWPSAAPAIHVGPRAGLVALSREVERHRGEEAAR